MDPTPVSTALIKQLLGEDLQTFAERIMYSIQGVDDVHDSVIHPLVLL